MGDISVPSLDPPPHPSQTPHSSSSSSTTQTQVPCFVEHDPSHKVKLDLTLHTTANEVRRELVSWFPDLEQTFRGLVYLSESDQEQDPEHQGKPIPSTHGQLLHLFQNKRIASICALTDRKFIEVELEDDETAAETAVISLVRGKGWREIREKIEECFEEWLEKRPIEELFWRNKEGIIYPAPESLSVEVLFQYADMIIVRQVKKADNSNN
jgi:hypothetical protein